MASHISHTSIMDLNDDCLLLIFDELDLNDHFSIARTCLRFRELTKTLLKMQYYNINLCLSAGNKDRTIQRVAKVSKIARKLEVSLDIDGWKILQQYTFPHVTEFQYSQRDPFPMDDDCILKMTEMFPKLRAIAPSGPFSGKCVENFQNLEYINLRLCENLQFGNLETIFEKLHLKSVEFNVFEEYHEWTSEHAFKNFCGLEAMLVNFFELAWLSNLSKFTNLKEIVIADHDFPDNFRIQEFLESFDEYKSKDLIALLTKLKFPFQGSKTREFMHLKNLIVCKQSIPKYIDIQNYAPNLREVMFFDCYVPTSKDLSSLLIQNVDIKSISVGRCRCGFREFTANIQDITQHRTKPLHFNFFENYFHDLDLMERDEVKLNVDGRSPLLQITTTCFYLPMRNVALHIRLRGYVGFS